MKKKIPRPEHPEPMMVRDTWLNLNGEWTFELDPGNSGEERGLVEKKLSRRITVPFCPESKLSGINCNDFMEAVWYRRTFWVPASWNGGKVLLHFGAVDYKATVWINGKEIGTHQGGYTPFYFEIGKVLKNNENVIVVRAVDDNRSQLQPCGKQSLLLKSRGGLYSRTTGIWQTVWLEKVSETYLNNFRFYPDLDNGRIAINAGINGDTKNIWLKTRASARGKEVAEFMIPAHQNVFFTLQLAKIIPWEPANPFLYDLEFSLIKNNREVDTVKSYAGLRTIGITGNKIFLNHKPIFMRFVLDQGYYPDGIYTASNQGCLRRDIEISMGMGFNGARLHQKVFEPRFLYWADKLGYLVWGEFPDWGIKRRNSSDLAIILPEWLEVLKRDFNHPSIIGWCPLNETTPNSSPELIENLYLATKQADPTRPVIDSSGSLHIQTDIYDVHDYEQDPQKFADHYGFFKNGKKAFRNFPEQNAPYRNQPYFVSEYGGTWWNPEKKNDKTWGGYGKRPKTKTEFLERYRALTETLLFHPRISGFGYTQLYDTEQEVNGLYTYDRRSKFDPKKIKAINFQKAAVEDEAKK